MRYEHLRPEFVEVMPDELEGGVLYVSTRFRTAAHLCACGCDSRIVTPIRPAKWKFTYDGESISLWPSVGSWQKACQSHYIIKKSRVVWARKWSKREIEAGRRRDQADLHAYLDTSAMSEPSEDEAAPPPRFLSKVLGLFRRGT